MASSSSSYRFQSGFCPLSSSPSLGNFVERIKDACHFLVSAVLGTIISAILTFFFALGSFIVTVLEIVWSLILDFGSDFVSAANSEIVIFD